MRTVLVTLGLLSLVVISGQEISEVLAHFLGWLMAFGLVCCIVKDFKETFMKSGENGNAKNH